MGNRTRPEYLGITFDSQDELEFYWWCEEAEAAGLISDFTYQEPTFQLAEPVYRYEERFGARGQPIKPKRRLVLHGTSYTVDFKLYGIEPLVPVPEHVDVKPSFSRQASMDRYFTVVRKWVYQRHDVLVQAIVPKDLFADTFAPAQAMLSPKLKKPRKGYADFRTVDEYVRLLAQLPESDIVSSEDGSCGE